MSTTQTVLDLDQVCVNTMRTLAIDAIQKANSGHPGTPMGMSPTVYCLWQRLLRFDPEESHLDESRSLRAFRGARIDFACTRSCTSQESKPSIQNMKFWAAPPSRSTTSSLSGNSGAAALGTRSTVGPRAWKQPPVRSDKVWPRVWHGHCGKVARRALQQARF